MSLAVEQTSGLGVYLRLQGLRRSRSHVVQKLRVARANYDRSWDDASGRLPMLVIFISSGWTWRPRETTAKSWRLAGRNVDDPHLYKYPWLTKWSPEKRRLALMWWLRAWDILVVGQSEVRVGEGGERAGRSRRTTLQSQEVGVVGSSVRARSLYRRSARLWSLHMQIKAGLDGRDWSLDLRA